MSCHARVFMEIRHWNYNDNLYGKLLCASKELWFKARMAEENETKCCGICLRRVKKHTNEIRQRWHRKNIFVSSKNLFFVVPLFHYKNEY